MKLSQPAQVSAIEDDATHGTDRSQLTVEIDLVLGILRTLAVEVLDVLVLIALVTQAVLVLRPLLLVVGDEDVAVLAQVLGPVLRQT